LIFESTQNHARSEIDAAIPLPRKIICKSKTLRDHLPPGEKSGLAAFEPVNVPGTIAAAAAYAADGDLLWNIIEDWIMSTISRSAELPYSPRQVYDLVVDFAAYPQFLPWCRSAEVLSASEDEIEARVEIHKGGVSDVFTTVNRLQPGKMVEMRLLEGPFKQLEAFWRFDATQNGGCRLSLDMDYQFSNTILGLTVGPIFAKIAKSLVDDIGERARSVYG
jgi:ribosome-associated toxin RatA of RatAB toxin-antitoxin module